jgi:hypothetical protein
MRGGDISNETSPKIIVVADVVVNLTEEEITTGSGLFKKKSKKQNWKINLKEVSHLWNLANKYGMSIELAGFSTEGWTQELLEDVMESLERRVSNPFNYAEVYEDVEELVSMLPYRGNLKGVIDLASRVAMYGSWGVELNNL